VDEAHWLVQLDKHLWGCHVAIARSLILSVPWGGDVEERNVQWMEDETLSNFHTPPADGPATPPPAGPTQAPPPELSASSSSSPPPPLASPRRPTHGHSLTGSLSMSASALLDPEVEAAFLQSLVRRETDGPGQRLVAKMRAKVMEDRGMHEAIDNAVYASIAALIKASPCSLLQPAHASKKFGTDLLLPRLVCSITV
jgi:hypothetical protein